MFSYGLTLGTFIGPYSGVMMPAMANMIGQLVNWIFLGVTIIAFYANMVDWVTPMIMYWTYGGVTLLISIVFCCMMVNVKGCSAKEVQDKLK